MNQFDAIWNRENVVRAAFIAQRGKRRSAEITDFFNDLPRRIAQISHQLRHQCYSFGRSVVFQVRDTKTRTIHAPPFSDRVVHHAIMSILADDFTRGASEHSYACRPGFGQHAALRCAKRWTRRKRWFGKMDFQRFYDSVCHNTLQKMICRKFADVRIQRLLWQIIDDFHHSPGRGIPIGALTSQYFGNFYLDAFDRQLRASGRCRRMLRYMDDVLVFGDRDDLRQIRGLAYQAAENLRLSTKHGGVWNRCDRGVPYLGFVLYPDRIRVNREGRKRFGRRIGAVMRDLRRGQITDRAAQDCMRSLVAHTDFANDVAWRRSVLDRKQECDA
ncbi:MAG: reverse transcriptase domain-containing protein [Planctomycetota bacterium]